MPSHRGHGRDKQERDREWEEIALQVAARMNPTDLARLLGISPKSTRKYYTGETSPSAQTLRKIKEILACPTGAAAT